MTGEYGREKTLSSISTPTEQKYLSIFHPVFEIAEYVCVFNFVADKTLTYWFTKYRAKCDYHIL